MREVRDLWGRVWGLASRFQEDAGGGGVLVVMDFQGADLGGFEVEGGGEGGGGGVEIAGAFPVPVEGFGGQGLLVGPLFAELEDLPGELEASREFLLGGEQVDGAGRACGLFAGQVRK